jgi:hypothetical protein
VRSSQQGRAVVLRRDSTSVRTRRFAVYDSSAPYSGPYPMALLVRAFLLEEINDWDETALHSYLRANPALRRDLGFETLPDNRRFSRGWNHRCSTELHDAVRECADGVTAARAYDVSLVNGRYSSSFRHLSIGLLWHEIKWHETATPLTSRTNTERFPQPLNIEYPIVCRETGGCSFDIYSSVS